MQVPREPACEATMTEPVSTADPGAHGSRSATARPPTRRPSSGRGTRSGRTGCSPATSRCGRPTRDVAETIAERLGWLDAPAHFAERIAGARGLRRRGRSTRASRPPSSPGWAAAAWRRTSCSGRSATPDGYLDAAHPRLDRSGATWRRPSTISTRSRRWSSSPASRARRPSRTRSSPTRGRAPRRPSTQIHHHVYEQPGRLLSSAITDPGKSVDGDPPPRRLPRGLPQPARHRRPVLAR